MRPPPSTATARSTRRAARPSHPRAGRRSLPIRDAADLAADDISGRPCVETIYTAVYAGVLDVNAADCLRMRRPRRRSRQARNPSTRPALPNISDRPAPVNERAEIGHWEADQIIGARNRSSMLTLTERVTRYTILVTMPDGYTADAMVAGLVDGLDRIPGHLLRSVTFDQSSEWANWAVIAEHYGIDCWFCEPHSPWHRGQIENINRQARWWFPRGTDLTRVDPDHADHVASIINGQRRRHLNSNSPTTLYAAARTVH